MSNGVSDLTYGDLKQYALDKLQDNTGEKSDRQAGRAVTRALRAVSEAGDWEWLRSWWRFILRERIPCGGAGGSTAAFANSVRYPEGVLGSAENVAGADGRHDAMTGWSFYFSGTAAGGQTLHRVVDYYRGSVGAPSADKMIFHSNDQVVANTTGRLTGLNGYLLKDRYLLPRRFKAFVSEPKEQEFLSRLSRISPEEMLYQKKTWSPESSDPVFYCIQKREDVQQREVIFWPAPTQRRAVDVLISTYMEEPSADSDVIAWDPNHAEVIYAAIDRQVAIERNDRALFSQFDKAFKEAVWRAKGADMADNSIRVASQGRAMLPWSVEKTQRSQGFTDVP